MAVTALQLVNRVRRMHRFPDTAALTDGLSKAILDQVNSAMQTVLEERTWNWQTRTDGYIRTNQTYSGSDLIMAAAGTTAVITANPWTSPEQSPFNDDRIAELVVTDDDDYSSTSFTCDSGDVSDSFAQVWPDQAWPGATNTAGDYLIFSHKFILPSTVRAVLSVKHQETPVRVFFAEEFLDYDKVFPRPWDYRDDSPDFVVVGGFAKSSRDRDGDLSAGENVEGMKMLVHPVPSEEYVLNYSYIYRVAELSATTDDLGIVPESIANIIGDLAYARSLQVGIGNDPTTGFAMERRVLADLSRRYAAQKADPVRRSQVPSLDDVNPSGGEVGRLPRVVESY